MRDERESPSIWDEKKSSWLLAAGFVNLVLRVGGFDFSVAQVAQATTTEEKKYISTRWIKMSNGWVRRNIVKCHSDDYPELTHFSLLFALVAGFFEFFSSPSHSKTSSSPTMTRSSRTKQRRIDVKWKINFDSYFDNTRMHAFTRLIRTRRFLRVKKDPISQQRVEKSLNSKHFTRNHQQFPANWRSKYAASEWERTKTWREKNTNKDHPKDGLNDKWCYRVRFNYETILIIIS